MHLSFYQLNRYRHARIEPAELLSMDDHLVQCEFCRQQLLVHLHPQAALSSLRANLQAVAEEDHLSPAECGAFNNNALTAVERELVASHLDTCAICTAQLNTYRAAQAKPPQRHVLLALLDSWRERLTLVWPIPVVATMVIALLAFVDIFYFRPNPQPPAPESVQQVTVPKPNDPSVVPLRPENKTVESAKPHQAEPDQLAHLTFPPALAALRGEKATRSGNKAGTTFQLTHPIGTFVFSPRPTLRWQRLPGATNYTVKVFSTDYELIVESPALQATAWTLPTTLARGKTYLWQVTAQKNDQEIAGTSSAAEAKFAVLDQAQAKRIEQLRRRTKAPLALGIAYAQAGLLDDAEAIFRTRPRTAQQLLQQLRAARRQ